jgi:flagellar hook-length control protein FliK
MLTTPVPGGESWPATGKELPVLPVESAAADTAANTAPDLLSGLVPAAVADAALQARLRFTSPPTVFATEALPPAVPSIEAKPVEVAAPATRGGQTAVTTDMLAPPVAGDLEPIAALATGEAELALLEGVEPESASAAAKSALALSWLEAFTHERRMQRPTAAAPADLRAAASAATTATSAALTPHSVITAAPPADALQAALGGTRQIELPKLLATAVAMGGEGTSIAQPDWLPPATQSSAASAAVSAAPPGTPVDLRSPNGPETFAHRVQWLVDQQVGEAHIKLNPPELGAVEVKISLVDDKTYVQLTTATAAAREELSQSLSRLRELFAQSGLELGGASVHNGRDGHSARHGYGADAPDSRPFAPFSDDGEDMPAFLPRRTLGSIDVFA